MSGVNTSSRNFTDAISSLWGDLTVNYANVNISSSGSNIVVAAVANKVIKVIQFTLIAASAVTITFESDGGTFLHGPVSYAANGGEADPFCPVGHFKTAKGEGLIINLGSSVAVGGHLVYVLSPG